MTIEELKKQIRATLDREPNLDEMDLAVRLQTTLKETCTAIDQLLAEKLIEVVKKRSQTRW